MQKTLEEGTEFATPEALPVVLAPLNQDPDLLNKLFQRFTATNAAALADRPLFMVRTLTFTVSGEECSPGIFVDDDGLPFDFTLTLKAMSSEEEIKALTDAPPGHAATMHLTKRMLHKVNGSRFPEAQRDFLWEALGMRVRALCFQAYLQLSGPSSAAVGKFQESSSIGTA